MTDQDYLRELAERLMAVPAVHGVDQSDVDRLLVIVARIARMKAALEQVEYDRNKRLPDNLGDDE